MADDWHVLIEEDTRETRRAEGAELKLHRWTLVATHPVEGGQERALAVAEDAALHYLPAVLARHARSGDVPARRAFLTPDGSWLVWVGQRHRECHLRVTAARLVHVREESVAPPKSLKEKLRTALDGPEPFPAPWKPRS
ncbi:hypothetical protein ACIQJ4_08690 [Streptomyces filamentosus]|uniref:hypothetical protein n=1 Tax=Streptomyces filamentosus TaxID=67294 RepID=UPI00381E9970